MADEYLEDLVEYLENSLKSFYSSYRGLDLSSAVRVFNEAFMVDGLFFIVDYRETSRGVDEWFGYDKVSYSVRFVLSGDDGKTYGIWSGYIELEFDDSGNVIYVSVNVS